MGLGLEPAARSPGEGHQVEGQVWLPGRLGLEAQWGIRGRQTDYKDLECHCAEELDLIQ